MNCQEFEARLNELLDERAPLEPDERLDRHVLHCAACRGLYAGYRELAELTRFRPLPEPSPDLADRIVAAAVQDYQRGGWENGLPRHAEVRPSMHQAVARSQSTDAAWRKTANRWYSVAGIAVAAAVLVAVCWRFEPSVNRSAPPGDGAASASRPGTNARPLTELAQDAARCYASLARETRNEFSDVMALVPDLDSMPGATLWNDAQASSTPEVASHLREGLRPLADSTRAALTSLFGAAPRQKGDL